MPNLPTWTLSQQSRGRLNDLLKSASDLGLDPDAVASGGLAALQALMTLQRATDAGEGTSRTRLITRVQDAVRGLDPAIHGDLLQQIQSRVLALQGRNGDTEVVHVTPGEIVLPKALQTPGVLGALRQAAARANIPLDQLRIGSALNSINPATGRPEFAGLPEEDVEEITITAPRETGIVQLPQNLPDSGFYNYGTPRDGAAQFGVPAAMYVVGAAGNAWKAAGHAPFGVGNMSKADLSPYDDRKSTSDHSKGTGIDIRPMRTDGKPLGIRYDQAGYDREATQALVNQLLATGGVKVIFFNDPEIKGVTPDRPGQGNVSQIHDNHLHVRVNPNWRRPPGD